MRHNRKKKHLGRTSSHRKAMLSNLITSLFEEGRIRTTQAKAKEGRRLAEKLITFAKRGDLHARRQVLKTMPDKSVVKRLFDEIGPRFADRNGGYTRIVKLGPRIGDRAPLVLFELLGEPKTTEAKGEKKKKEKATASKKTAKQAPKEAKEKTSARRGGAKKARKTADPSAREKRTRAKTRPAKKAPKG